MSKLQVPEGFELVQGTPVMVVRKLHESKHDNEFKNEYYYVTEEGVSASGYASVDEAIEAAKNVK